MVDYVFRALIVSRRENATSMNAYQKVNIDMRLSVEML